MAEIARLEDVFSLLPQRIRPWTRLNASGTLGAPPELLECLTLAGAVHKASAGLFDPTVQAALVALRRSHGAGAPAE